MTPRPYQIRTIEAVRAHWTAGRIACLIIAPTGAGKTVQGEELIDDGEPWLWLAHTRELVRQVAKRLRSRFGRGEVGVVMPGDAPTPSARIQVATVQTLLARGIVPTARRLVLDEAHHYAAEDWRVVSGLVPWVRILGLTATPERKDGEPLGDIFEVMVVSASYSELVAGGYLVPARVHRPRKALGNDLAQDPVKAWAATASRRIWST